MAQVLVSLSTTLKILILLLKMVSYVLQTLTGELSLPASYAIVPAVALNESKTSVPARLCFEFHGNLESARLQEQEWLKHAMMALESTMEEWQFRYVLGKFSCFLST